ncbi:putative lipoprotein [Cyanobacterium aponinum PCC 10605]|uniref:Putative lipoprotein n=1 Tax=Cyanobacterium aponinum (strain PCC 10605) TaxID=755178 RepID=K9Z9N7_CYAAP|nr:putative lipoprotein [Cyanobacterium aponinum PCC 10605]
MLYFQSLLNRFCSYVLILLLFSCQKETRENSELEAIIITPEEKQVIISKIYENQKDIKLCNQERDQALSIDSTEIYPLKENQYLVEILCFLGAYQGNYQYLLYNRVNSAIEKISFATFRDNPQNLQLTNTFTLNGSPEFDPISQTLSLETKSRGLGDCGSFVVYQWQNSEFTLREYRYKSDCDGVYLSPEKYPLIYP